MIEEQLVAAAPIEQTGIKELKEMILAVNELALFVVARAKDGVGVDDAMALIQKIMGEEEFSKVLSAAVEGASKVPAEIKNVDLNEAMELAMLQLGYIPRYAQAIAK